MCSTLSWIDAKVYEPELLLLYFDGRLFYGLKVVQQLHLQALAF